MTKPKLTPQNHLHQFLYFLGSLRLLMLRYLLELLMLGNEVILMGASDSLLESLSKKYNARLIRFQLEQIDKGFATGLKVQSFDIGHGCWIATVSLDQEIVKDPRATAFVQDVVAYTTHNKIQNIMATFISENQVRIVVGDQRID